MHTSYLMAFLIAIAEALAEARPKALVYRGPAVSEGCPESVADLLENSPWNFTVAFAGPDEDIDVTEKSLKDVQVFAFPGGPDQKRAWKSVKGYKKPLQDYVSNGGHYLGFCLGAYMAGPGYGFDLLPRGVTVGSEIEQRNSQVTKDDDTVIQVDWTFQDGKTEPNRWLYFQEGAFIKGLDGRNGAVLARYSKSRDVAASVTIRGKGSVGLVGPHPEADESWYDDAGVTNPDGIKFDVGYDFIDAALKGVNGS